MLKDTKFRLVNMNSGDLAYYTVDSLSAFWPGLQVLAGDVENAIKLHLLCESSRLTVELRSADANALQIITSGNDTLASQKCLTQTIASQLPISILYAQVCTHDGSGRFVLLRRVIEFVESTWYLYRVRCDFPSNLSQF